MRLEALEIFEARPRGGAGDVPRWIEAGPVWGRPLWLGRGATADGDRPGLDFPAASLPEAAPRLSGLLGAAWA